MNNPSCPECGGSKLAYEEVQDTRLEGDILLIGDRGPVLDAESEVGFSNDYVQITCKNKGCNASWPSWDDFLTCFYAENHDEECVL